MCLGKAGAIAVWKDAKMCVLPLLPGESKTRSVLLQYFILETIYCISIAAYSQHKL